MDAQTLILNKLDSIDRKIDRFNQRISTLEATVEPLFDNGQPGRMTKAEDRITALERTNWRERGFFGAIILFLEIGYHLIAKKIGF